MHNISPQHLIVTKLRFVTPVQVTNTHLVKPSNKCPYCHFYNYVAGCAVMPYLA